MIRNSVVEKKKVEWDGEEIPGLIKVDELKFENKTIDVTDFFEEHTIDSYITKVPSVVLTYRCDIDTKTLQFFEDFHFKKQYKDGTMMRTDGEGKVLKRYLLKDCRCIVSNIPPYDSATPQVSSITITVTPWKIIPISAG